ncbi:unnamed protein product, partial [Mesorhabditis belari]|uniref:Dynamin-like GTPase OPA1, mitochondrial n=1 Tax=Mesorhabditis belari TaxID=2138241 RepID=A0AAF3F6U2_9BILA
MLATEKTRPFIYLISIFGTFICLLGIVYYNFPKLDEEDREHFKYPRNLDDAKQLGRVLSHYKDQHYYLVMCGIVVVYVMLQSFAIPGSIFLSILSGYLFPFFIALILVCSCSAIGATVCYLLSFLLGRRLVLHYFPDRVVSWQLEIEKHKEHLFNYIVFLRVTPLLPNWFINIASPVLNVPATPFFWGTFLGVAPPSFLFIQAGATLETMTHTNVAWYEHKIMVAVVYLKSSRLVPLLHRLAIGQNQRRLCAPLSTYHVSRERNGQKKLLVSRRHTVVSLQQERRFVGIVATVARSVLRLRWFIATGAIGGSLAARNWYEDWKSKLPDFSMPEWVKFEESGAFNELSEKLASLRAGFGDARAEGKEKWAGWMQKLEQRRNGQQESNSSGNEGSGAKEAVGLAALFTAFGGDNEKKDETVTSEERLQKLQEEMLRTQSQYQHELERLEKENKVLKQRLLLTDQGAARRLKRLKRSLIDMYSEVLDLLNEYDSSYNTADNLPRVVVVGDQSAGKTSVLEMVAQARIFPRGSGEMMTRAPVKVTLSEGPYHVASFKDSTREFDLTKEADLRQLRSEIEIRMRNSVKGGKTVSHEVIALTVKGPNLPRMVLVDLPGVISTVTADMARETKDDIIRMSRQHMENPNAIILCIQDGSVDAERSNVTDLVSSIDPSGQRTILVLTKVDLAEQNLTNPERIRRILEGNLFNMKALGYFGVVTGRGNSNESIEEIRKYEEEFFSKSKLLKDGVLKHSQMTTRNMSFAVSECFWRMVRDSIESQCDAFRATRFNLETEWKNNFPRLRQLDRDELFDKARGEILDEIVNLSLVGAEEWERMLQKRLWASVAGHVFDQILMPTSSIDNAGSFNTQVDIKLKHFADKDLALKSVDAGWDTLREVFRRQIENDNRARRDHGSLFDSLKKAVVDAACEEHHWDEKAMDYLRVIQQSAIEDRAVHDKRAWDKACSFMRKKAEDRLAEVTGQLGNDRGPGIWGKWIRWQSSTAENHFCSAIQDEIKSILSHEPDHRQALTEEDLLVIKRNIETKGFIEVPTDLIRKQWKLMFKKHFLEKTVQSARDCTSLYQHYRQGLNDQDLDCQAVVLFYRIEKMISLTCNALRQQITNTEQRRLEKEIKDVLDTWSSEPDVKKQLLTGRLVELAEELKQVRHIQERLEEFMTSLQREKH